jgi:fido (protein-threonine AMPylation protein)
MRQLAEQAGYAISWAGISQAENIAASIASHTSGDNSGLVKIIETAIAQGSGGSPLMPTMRPSS